MSALCFSTGLRDPNGLRSPPWGLTKHQSYFRLQEFTPPPDGEPQHLPAMLPSLFSTTDPEEKERSGAQRAFQPQARPRKSCPNSFHPKLAPGTEVGAARVPPPAPGRLSILTGLSPLCSPSSRALWQPWRRPHLAVARSSGPRPEGTFRPPRAAVPPPGPPPAAAAPGGAGPARRPAPPPRPPPRAHPGRARAAGRQPGPVRATAIGPSERGRAAREGRGGPRRRTASFPTPGAEGEEKETC